MKGLPVEEHVAVWVAKVVVSIENSSKNVEETEAKDTTEPNPPVMVNHDVITRIVNLLTSSSTS